MIEVKNLTKRYGTNTALNNVSFTVEEGTIVGFLGPNGAGKSTTMNIITGYLSATSGSVTVQGKNTLENPNEVKKLIGYLPELPPLYMDMTVKEYLNFMYELKGVKLDRKQHIGEICRLTKIDNVYTRLIGNLSKGYKQRVGIAQALLGNPPVLILDEPTVGLDPKQIIEIRNLIKSLGRNHTIILSSHILPEVQAVCERVILIDDSIVRGTTSDQIVNMLKDAGAKEVHMRISSPPFLWPCYFGIDVPERHQLIAYNHTVDEICKEIGADTLGYLRLERLPEMVNGLGICTGCFTGDYPIPAPEEDIRGEYEA